VRALIQRASSSSTPPMTRCQDMTSYKSRHQPPSFLLHSPNLPSNQTTHNNSLRLFPLSVCPFEYKTALTYYDHLCHDFVEMEDERRVATRHFRRSNNRKGKPRPSFLNINFILPNQTWSIIPNSFGLNVRGRLLLAPPVTRFMRLDLHGSIVTFESFLLISITRLDGTS
jgi:hypothetical protein